MDQDELKALLEAALLAATHPLSVEQLGQLFDEAERPSLEAFGRALEALAQDCAGRGIELVEVASGFRYQVKTALYPRIARLWTERPSRYSRATLETLAVIAYRQPVTRAEIEQLRGVTLSSSILKTLEERDWVRVVGHKDLPGRPALYGTTRSFLDYFGLKSLDQLPPLAELKDFDAMLPELDFPDSPGSAPSTPELDPDPHAVPRVTLEPPERLQ
jgi:segregation and condensation protein B